jgi:hypothetical protein
MSVPPDIMQLIQGANEPEPLDQDRINALRRQQALGVLGQMGGANVGQFGQAMYTGAQNEMEQMREQQQAALQQEGRGLDLATKYLGLQKAQAEIAGMGDEEWVYKADPVHGGIIAISKKDPNVVKRITGAGAPGEGGGLVTEDNPYGLQLGGNRKPREDEVRSAYNLNRISRRAEMIASIAKENPALQKPGFLEQVARGQEWEIMEGLLQPEERQIIESAQADILDAALWLATGAAYNREQLLGQAKAYLPKWQDKPRTIAYKREALADLIQAAHLRAGAAVDPSTLERSLAALDSIYSIPGVSTPAERRGGEGAGAPKMPKGVSSITEVK